MLPKDVETLINITGKLPCERGVESPFLIANRCCPSGNICAVLSSNIVGCCPAGQSCQGFSGAISTITAGSGNQIATNVQVIQTSAAQPTGGALIGDPIIQTVTVAGNIACTTMTMNGAGVPTFRSASCGQMLILPGDAVGRRVKSEGWMLLIVVMSVALCVLGMI
jgi:hypothetical protein